MNNRSGFDCLSAFRQLMLALVFALASLMLPGQANAQSSPASFNHDTTMFALRGAHETVRCETCHVNGVFKGTPRQCNLCHAQGNRMGAVPMTNNHIPVTDQCDVCHNTSTFSGTQFTHAMVMPGSCNTCHNGYYAKGKSPSPPHPVTTASCDLCHSIGSFTNAIRFDHAASGIFAAPAHSGPACDSCHNGVRAEGKSPNHVPVPAGSACDDCHRQTTAWKPAVFVHEAAGISSQPKLGPACSSCHNGTRYLGKPAGNAHIPTTQDCSLCHSSSPIVNPGGFALGQMDHTGIISGCATCHGYNSPYPPLGGKPVVTPSYISNHIPVQGVACEACHASGSFTSFAGGVMNHAAVTAISCATCHEDGTNYAGLTSSTLTVMRSSLGTHYPMPTNIACSVCHTSTTDFSQGIVYSPSGVHQAAVVNTGCASCHSDGAGPFAAKQSLVNLSSTPAVSASGLPHIALNANVDCSSCHVAGKVASFNPGNNGFRLPGTINAPSLSAAQHALVSTACSTCHGGTGNSVAQFAGIIASTNSAAGDTFPPPGLDQAHQSYGNDCAGCHQTSPTFLSNGAGSVKPAGHIPVGNLTCATCHGAPASYTAPNLVATHTTGLSCTSCHTQAISAGAASLGTTIRFMGDAGLQHIPVGSLGASNSTGAPTCDSAGCHANFSASGQSFVIGAGATPTSVTSPTLNTTGHNTVYAAGQTSCNACHEAGMSFQGMMATTNPASGTGAGRAGDTRPAYNGHPASGECSGCHSTTPVFANNASLNAQPAGHIPSGSAACSACHGAVTSSGNFGSPSVALTHSSQNQACFVCHNATTSAGITANATALGFGGVAAKATVYNDSTHFPVNGVDCASSGCHASYATSSSFVLARGAAGSPSVAFAGHASVTGQSCVSCHDATHTYKGLVSNPALTPTDVFPSAAVAPLHQGAGYVGVDCGTCHTINPLFKSNPVTLPPMHIPLGSASITCTNCHASGNYTTAAVNLVTTHATGQKCAACHDSSVANTFISDKTIVSQSSVSNHIPFGSMDCGTACHANYAASVTSFKIGTGVASITVPTLNVAQHTAVAAAGVNSCSTCHTQPNGTLYYGMVASKVGGGDQFPSTTEDPSHQSYTGDCSACHTTTPTFVNNANGTVKPAGHIPVGSLTCATCHGSPASYSAPNLVATHTTGLACAACHNSSISSGAANLGTPVLRYNSDNGAMHIPIGSLGSTTAAAGATTCNASGCHANYTASGQSFVIGTGANPTNSQISTPTLTVAGHNSVLTAGITSCSQCHAATTGIFQGMVATNNTINTTTNSGTAGDTRPTYGGHPATGDCGQCHSTTPTFSLSPSQSAQPTGHIPSGSAACSACHTAASGNNFGAPDIGLTHSSQTQACSACHNATVSAAITANATALGYGGVAAKATVINDSSHFPIGSVDCAASGCHATYANSPTFVLARGAAGTPSVAFAGHASVTSQTCVSCHDATKTYKGLVTNASANPTDVFPSASQDALHQNYTGDCGTCHTVTPLFNTNPIALPPKHIPIGSVGVACANCHTAGNYTTTGVNLVTTHTTGQTCKTCHASAVATTFLTDTAIKNETSITNHIPFGSMDCGTACHANYTASVLNFKMNGTGTASITVPTLNVAQHTAVASAGQSTCGTCHTTPGGTLYAGMLASAIGGGDQFPSSTEDAAHQNYTGDCVSCHTTSPTFKTNAIGGGLPTNHIPLTVFATTPACSACHINSSTYVTARMNHSPSTGGITASCNTCHGAAGVAKVFANVTPKAAPSNHISTTVGSLANACEKCHRNAASNNFTSFAGTVMDHSGITTSCTTCHGVGNAASFFGVTMVVAPNAATDGHRLVATLACETCHTNTQVTGGFANGKMVHAQVSGSTCVSCHEIGSQFTGVTNLWVRNGANHHAGQDCGGSGCHNTSDKSLGTGTTAAAGRVLTATSLSISSPAVGTAATKTIGLNNSGTAALTITSLVMSGTNAADFTQTNTCGTSLAAGGNCVITVSFKPSATGNRTATMTLTDNSLSKTQAISLTGAVATTSLSAANVVALSSIAVGTASPTQALTFTNTSTVAVGVSSVAITGTNAVDFKVASNTCPTTATLAANASCSIGISFTPTINTAQESALLTIANTGFPSAYVLQLVGSTGVASAAAQQRRVTSGSQVVKGTSGSVPASVAALLGTTTTTTTLGNSMINARGLAPVVPGATVAGAAASTTVAGRPAATAAATSPAVPAPPGAPAVATSGTAGATPSAVPAQSGIVVPSALAGRAVPAATAFAGAPAGSTVAPNAPFNHSAVVPGQCFTCHDGNVHNGVKVSGKPSNHIPSVNTCDTCHRTTSWVPALFSHSQNALGMACTACHNGRTTATRMPPRHMLTVRTCDTCHRTNAWIPVTYQHISPRFNSQYASVRCDTCHIGNTEMVPPASVMPNLGGTRMRPH